MGPQGCGRPASRYGWMAHQSTAGPPRSRHEPWGGTFEWAYWLDQAPGLITWRKAIARLLRARVVLGRTGMSTGEVNDARASAATSSSGLSLQLAAQATRSRADSEIL